MRRGLLKDLANTPTQIVCGWRLYGPDLKQLAELRDETVSVDLLTGDCYVRDLKLDPPLYIADEVMRWLRDRLQRDGVPEGTVSSATQTLRPRSNPRALEIEVDTVLQTQQGRFESHDTARWAPGDVSSV